MLTLRTIASLVLIFESLATGPASAAAVDFTAPVHGLDGKIATECKEAAGDGKGCKRSGPLTLGEIAAAGLSMPDRGASLADQIRRGRLAQLVIDGKTVDLTAEQISLIKEQVAKLGISPVYVLQLVEAIDPAAVK